MTFTMDPLHYLSALCNGEENILGPRIWATWVPCYCAATSLRPFLKPVQTAWTAAHMGGPGLEECVNAAANDLAVSEMPCCIQSLC